MSTKSILINFAGYPVSPRSLAPDNGLAILASCLINKGHETIILDYMTVNIIERLFPHGYRDKLRDMVKHITKVLSESSCLSQSDLNAFYEMDTQIAQIQRERVQEIAGEINDYINKHKIDFIGMKLWLGDGFEGSITIARELKRNNPHLPIFAGGPHVDFFKERIFDITDIFDVLVYGEGEETITMLADYVEGKTTLDSIPNLIYKKNGKVVITPIKRLENLNDSPWPTYDETVYLAMKGDQKLKIAIIDESRGCPNSCNFCIHFIKSGNRRRTKDPEAVVIEMERMKKEYGINAFKFAGSNPPPKLKREIAKKIIERKLNVSYTTFGHAQGAAEEDFNLLKESGCYAVFFGIESGCQRILDKSINKRTKINDIKEAIKACKSAGLYVVGSVIIPAPGETEQSKKETLDLLLEIKPDSIVICFPTLLLGTEWERNKEKYGFEVRNPKKLFQKIMTYKMKSFYPPSLWETLDDYKLNGKTFRENARESDNFERALEREGFLTRVADEMLLISKYSGMDPKEFRDKSNEYLSTGNYEEIAKIVKEINRRILNS